MAPSRDPGSAPKRGRKKKNKSRTQVEVSSSSESDSDTQIAHKKTNKSKATSAPPPQNGDVSMTDAQDAPSSPLSKSSSPEAEAAKVPAKASSKAKPPQRDVEEFSDVYLKKVTAELADDLVKVRDAQDFKASSLPMLVHALRQGSSIYSAEEKRMVVNATG